MLHKVFLGKITFPLHTPLSENISSEFPQLIADNNLAVFIKTVITLIPLSAEVCPSTEGIPSNKDYGKTNTSRGQSFGNKNSEMGAEHTVPPTTSCDNGLCCLVWVC